MIDSTGSADVLAYARQVDEILADAAADLRGTYLHGSAALGGYIPGRSDVDLLAICGGRSQRREALLLAAEQVACLSVDGVPAVELSVVTADAARDPRAPWAFVLHVSTRPGVENVVVGTDTPGDPDLLMHYAVCRSAGIAVRGPAPAHVIGEVARQDVLAYLCDELDWAVDHAPERYGVLNACRALAYLRDGRILSKLDGAADALARGAPHDLVSDAVAMQRGILPDRAPGPMALRFIAEARRALAAGRTGPGTTT